MSQGSYSEPLIVEMGQNKGITENEFCKICCTREAKEKLERDLKNQGMKRQQ